MLRLFMTMTITMTTGRRRDRCELARGDHVGVWTQRRASQPAANASANAAGAGAWGYRGGGTGETVRSVRAHVISSRGRVRSDGRQNSREEGGANRFGIVFI